MMTLDHKETEPRKDDETGKLLKRFGLQWNEFTNNECIETTGWTDYHVPQLLPVLLDGLRCSRRSNFSTCPNAVKSLSLEACSLGDDGIQRLCSDGAFSSLASLVYLNLGGNDIQNSGAKALANSLYRLTMLQELKLAWNRIGDAGGVSIVQTLPQTLRLLDMSGCSVQNHRRDPQQRRDHEHREDETDCTLGPKTCQALAQILPQMTHLYRIVLDRQPLLPEGVVTLANALPECPSLRELSLQNIPVDAQGATALSQVLIRCHLVVLHLNVNAIDSQSARHLAKSVSRCPSLRDVRLTQSRMHIIGLKSFEQTAAVHVGLERLDVYGHGARDRSGRERGGPIVRQIERWMRLNRRTQRFLADDTNHHLLPELWSHVARRGNTSRLFQTIQRLPVSQQITGDGARR